MTNLLENSVDPRDLILWAEKLDPNSRTYRELRDRAAYLYLTGAFPTHLRVMFTRVLRTMTRMIKYRTNDDWVSRLIVDRDWVERLDLDHHPMVVTVRKFLRQGWKIVLSPKPDDRRPYGKIFLRKGERKAVVQANGSVLYDW